MSRVSRTVYQVYIYTIESNEAGTVFLDRAVDFPHDRLHGRSYGHIDDAVRAAEEHAKITTRSSTYCIVKVEVAVAGFVNAKRTTQVEFVPSDDKER